MILVGLTGSIGMGKSTAAQMFASLELPVHSADDTVHRLYSGRAAPMVEALAACRPAPLLWGIDWPHTELWADMPDDADLIDATPIRSLTPDVQWAIFVENPAALYGFHTGVSGDAPG